MELSVNLLNISYYVVQTARDDMVTNINTIGTLSKCKGRLNFSANLLAPLWDSRISKRLDKDLKANFTFSFSNYRCSEIMIILFIANAMLLLPCQHQLRWHYGLPVYYWEFYFRSFPWSQVTGEVYTVLKPDAQWSTTVHLTFGKDTCNGTVLIFVKTIWDLIRAKVGFDPWTTWVSV